MVYKAFWSETGHFLKGDLKETIYLVANFYCSRSAI